MLSLFNSSECFFRVSTRMAHQRITQVSGSFSNQEYCSFMYLGSKWATNHKSSSLLGIRACLHWCVNLHSCPLHDSSASLKTCGSIPLVIQMQTGWQWNRKAQAGSRRQPAADTQNQAVTRVPFQGQSTEEGNQQQVQWGKGWREWWKNV